MSSDEDTRISCKYGANCYQKNSAHHAKYKHPSKKRQILSVRQNTPKKQKRDAEEATPSNAEEVIRLEADISNSDDEETPEKPGAKQEVISNSEDEDTPMKQTAKQEQEETSDYDIVYSTDEEKENVTKEEVPKQLQPLLTFEDKKAFIKDKYLVEMPVDFYEFWDLCKVLNKNYPKDAFKSVGLTLVGPYDILDESFKNRIESDKFVLHWRYFYDPPEFQTLIRGNDFSGFHMGYFRDEPNKYPVFVGSNSAKKDCTIDQMGENIFGAINTYLDTLSKTADPFKKMSITKLQKSVQTRANSLHLDLAKSTTKMQTRSRKQVAKTFHNAGIMVSYDRHTTVGYRKLPVDDKQLRKLLERVSNGFPDIGSKAFTALQPILTAATIANDECDFGTALELATDIFCYGDPCFNKTVSLLFKTTYMLLQRDEFAEICRLHLQHRTKDKPYVIDLN